MDVTLTPKLREFVESKVKSGDYASANEVVQEGLQLLIERDQAEKSRWKKLHDDLAEGLAQSERGETVPFDESVVETVIAEGRKRMKNRDNG